MKTWRLLMSGKELFAMPRAAVLRTWVMNHIIHHRAQVSIEAEQYSVPTLYGRPDEGTM